MKNKKINLIKILGVILMSTLVFCACTKPQDKCYECQDTIDKIEAEEKDETKDFDIAKAEELLDYFGFNEDLGCDMNIYSDIYSDSYKKIQALKKVDSSKIKQIKCSDIYSKEVFDSSMGVYKGKYGVCDKNSTTNVVPYDEVNQIYKKMYGVEMEKEGFDTTGVGDVYFNMYDYDKTLNSFVKLNCGGCGGACGVNPYSIKKTKSAKITGNNLTIEVYYLAEMQEPDGLGYRLQTLKIFEYLKVDSIEEFKKEVLNKYLDKLDVYEVKFEKNGNDYIFKSLSKKLS